MSFQISELQESDIGALVEMDDLAMAGWPVAQAMHLQAQKDGLGSRKGMLTQWMRKAFENKNPNGIWVKATVPETGQLIAAAAWTWHLDDTFVDRPPPDRSADTPQEQTVYGAMREDWQEFRKMYFADQKWYHLQVLCTHPDWQRRGAGTMLVKYGCDKADEAGVISTLIATEAGHSLYLKNGFEVVRENSLDLRPFGVEGSELRRWMVRNPSPS